MNFALTSSNKFQYLFQGDDKVRNAAAPARRPEGSDQPAVQRLLAWGFRQPTHSLTHTWIAATAWCSTTCSPTSAAVCSSTYQDYDTLRRQPLRRQRPTTTSTRRATSRIRTASTTAVSCRSARPVCSSRSLLNSTRRLRKTHELKSDGTYFLSNTLGGDHSLKFGVGWNEGTDPRPSRTTAAARARWCSASATLAGCGDGSSRRGRIRSRDRPLQRRPLSRRSCATTTGRATTVTCRTSSAAAVFA